MSDAPPEYSNLARPLDELELSVRSANALSGAGLRTVADLVAVGSAELLRLRNFGRKSLWEVTEILADMGLGLNDGGDLSAPSLLASPQRVAPPIDVPLSGLPLPPGVVSRLAVAGFSRLSDLATHKALSGLGDVFGHRTVLYRDLCEILADHGFSDKDNAHLFWGRPVWVTRPLAQGEPAWTERSRFLHEVPAVGAAVEFHRSGVWSARAHRVVAGRRTLCGFVIPEVWRPAPVVDCRKCQVAEDRGRRFVCATGRHTLVCPFFHADPVAPCPGGLPWTAVDGTTTVLEWRDTVAAAKAAEVAARALTGVEARVVERAVTAWIKGEPTISAEDRRVALQMVARLVGDEREERRLQGSGDGE